METGAMSEKNIFDADEVDEDEPEELKEEGRYRPLNFHERPRSDAEEVDQEDEYYDPEEYPDEDEYSR